MIRAENLSGDNAVQYQAETYPSAWKTVTRWAGASISRSFLVDAEPLISMPFCLDKAIPATPSHRKRLARPPRPAGGRLSLIEG